MKNMRRYTFIKTMTMTPIRESRYSIYASMREVRAQFDLEIEVWGEDIKSLQVFEGSGVSGQKVLEFRNKQENE